MTNADQEAIESRNKRTIWLLTGAAVSLVLPLLGLFFIRAGESGNAHPPSSAIMFDRREPGESRISANKAVVPTAKPARAAAPAKESSSLNFVKGSGDYFKDQEVPAKAPVPAAPPPPAPPKAPAKAGKKSFVPPKLQGVKTFNTFKKGSSQPATGKENILKNLPPGAENNPEVLKYLKGR